MPKFTCIIRAKFYPDYRCQYLPTLSVPNFPKIIHAKFTHIIHAKFYPYYPYQNWPSSPMPNF